MSVVAAALVRNSQILHEEIGAHITPFNRALDLYPSLSRFLHPDTPRAAAFLDRMVNTEATIIAYLNDFNLLFIISLCTLLLIPLIRRPVPGG